MSLPICKFFLNGHCKLKSQCPKSHKILTCFLGPYCKSSSCSFRHPKNCENFLLNGCNYPSCNHFHPPAQLWYNHTLLPPIVHPPNQPPYHPPSGLPHSTYPSPTPPPSHVPLQPTYSSELGLLKTKVQQLVTELESIKSNIQTQNHENGSSENVTVNGIPTIQEENQDTTTGNVRMDDEAPAMENIQTISDDSPDTNTEGAPVDSQEEGAGSDPIQNQEKHTESPPTQEELLNLTSKISAIETSQQNFVEGTKSWAKDYDEHFYKMSKDLDTIEDNTTKEISALEKRLGHTITNLEQRVKTMEAGLQNMKPKLEAAPSDKEALDRVVTMEENMNKEFSALRTQLESKTNSTEQSLSKLEHQFKILNFDNFLTGLGETQTKVDDVQKNFKDLRLKLETIEESIAAMPTALPIANDIQSPTEANNDYIAKDKCNNCQSSPCLDKETVTLDNLVNGAYFKGYLASGHVHGYTQVNGLNNYQVKWIKFSLFPCTDFIQTQDFPDHLKSLKFSCKT